MAERSLSFLRADVGCRDQGVAPAGRRERRGAPGLLGTVSVAEPWRTPRHAP
jgi:hypothetical protein